MCITILFPEFVFAKALCELKDAVDDSFEMKKVEEKLGWKVEFGKSCRALYRLFHLFSRKKQSTIEKSLSPRPGDVVKLQIVKPPTDGASNGAPAQSSPRSLPMEEQDPNIRSTNERHSPKTEGQPSGDNIDTGGVLQPPLSQQETSWTPVYSYFANMGGFDEDNQHNYYSKTTPVSAEIILLRCQDFQNAPIKLPSKADIEDKGKADLLVKLLAVLQIFWLLLSVIVRGIAKLPVSQLEIVTVAFSTIAVATYLCNLWKLKDVDVPIKLSFPKTLLESYPGPFWPYPNYSRPVNEANYESESFFENLLRPASGKRKRMTFDFRVPRVLNDTSRMRKGEIPAISIVLDTSTLIFGGLHCIAWSFEFPSEAEILIWRIASILSATIPCAAIFGNFLFALPINGRLRTFEQTTMTQTIVPRLQQILEQYPPEYWEAMEEARGFPPHNF